MQNSHTHSHSHNHGRGHTEQDISERSYMLDNLYPSADIDSFHENSTTRYKDQPDTILRELSSTSTSPVRRHIEDDHDHDHGAMPADAEKNVVLAKPNLFKRCTTNGWALELGCWLIGVVCLVSICALLVWSNGKSSQPFAYGITLNTLISLLATIARVALLVPVTQSISQLKWLWYQEPNGRGLMDFQVHHSLRSSIMILKLDKCARILTVAVEASLVR